MNKNETAPSTKRSLYIPKKRDKSHHLWLFTIDVKKQSDSFTTKVNWGLLRPGGPGGNPPGRPRKSSNKGRKKSKKNKGAIDSPRGSNPVEGVQPDQPNPQPQRGAPTLERSLLPIPVLRR